jgi:hypothetical protein
MILRVIRGRGDAAQLEELRRAVSARLAADAHGGVGPIRAHLGCRPGDRSLEVVVISCWQSAEAAARAEAREASPLALARRHLAACAAAHFEVDETILRRSPDDPVAIRVATGRFSKPGADIEMQELLRQRAPLVGEEMCEAYVGRRMADRAVEVTFVSAWRRLPTDRQLEEVFWPDIALRYDDFDVAVYTAIPCGPTGEASDPAVE